MKKILSFILVVCIVSSVLGMFTISASATTYTGSCGDNVTYTFDTETGVLTISGTGAMTDYSGSSTAPWYSERYYIKTIKFSEGVTSIGKYAFYDCDNLTSVTIGSGVTSIGFSAFDNCSDLASVTIGESVTSIDSSAFTYCRSLTSVTIPDSVTSIGRDAFSYCRGLTSVTIGEGVTSIRRDAFYGCRGLTSVTIGEGVTSIDSSAFEGCSSLTSITIPDSVTSIGSYAFRGCSGLTSITIGDSVTSIGAYAFTNCSGLTEINWNAKNVADFSSNNYVFYNAGRNGDGIKVIFGDKVERIPAYCFYPYSDIYYAPNITSVTIGDSVTSIGEDAFRDCSSLTSVVIGNGVTSIGECAFNGCSSLTDVYYNGTEEEWNAISIGTDNTYLTNATLHFKDVTVTFDGEEVETYGSIVLGTDNGDGTYSLPGNVVGYYIDDKFVDAGVYDVTGGEVITTVDFNVTMVNGAQVRYGGGLDENGKITSGNGLRFLAQVDRSNFDGSGYGMKLTAEGSDKETIVDAEKWQDDTTFTVALTDMAESNYIRKFTATPYVVVKYDDGTEKTIYGTQSVTRSIYNISAGLLANDEEYADDLIAVLNAYVNQTGIRLVIGEIGGEIKAHSAKYGDTLHFAVSDAAYDSAGNAYSVILTAQGNAKIITDNDFWYEYIRINNNNSLIRDKVTVERVEGTLDAVKVVFYADGLIERPADKNDNVTPDMGDEDFDGESEWN